MNPMSWTCRRCGDRYLTVLPYARAETCRRCYVTLTTEEKAALDPHPEAGPGDPAAGEPYGLFKGFGPLDHGPVSATLKVLAVVMLIWGIGSALFIFLFAAAGGATENGTFAGIAVLAAIDVFLVWLFRAAVLAGLAVAVEAALRARRESVRRETT